MSQFDGQTDTDLEGIFQDLYRQIMTGFDSLPLATWTPEYRAAIRDIQAREIEFRAIGIELARRLNERAAHWNETMDAALDGILDQVDTHPAVSRFLYACPCGGHLDWNDDATEATCQTCAETYDGIKHLKVVPDE
jgi:hypothetical protein